MKKIASIGNTEIYSVGNDKFKTNAIEVDFFDELSRERVYKNCLVLKVLSSGTENYPDQRALERRYMELYGTNIQTDRAIVGDIQIMKFILLYPEEKYIGTNDGLLEKGLDLLFEVIRKPRLENGAFVKSIFENEKNDHDDAIRASLNDKLDYALERLTEISFEGEPYAVPQKGKVEDGIGLDEKILYDYYMNYFLKKMKVRIFCSCAGDVSMIEKIIREKGYYSTDECVKTDIGWHTYPKREPVIDVERFESSQAKLVMSFKVDIEPESQDSFAFDLGSDILGGGFDSMLNQTVREKSSLAYFIYSFYRQTKGYMVIYCGIDEKSREKAEKLIFEQIERLKKGDFTNAQIESAKNKKINRLISISDGQASLVNYNSVNLIMGSRDTIDERIEKVKKITKKMIVSAAASVKHDATVFICGLEKKGDEAK
jgi:predicted Zn-dependent peptidase